MRLLLAAIALSATLAAPFAAQAARETAGQSCLVGSDGHAHVAATVADPTQCCTGRMQCAQFLSTTVVVRPSEEQHT